MNPYRGVVEVVDVGDAVAHSHDGQTWHLRADDGYGLIRPVGVWQEGRGLLAGQPGAAPDLLVALEARPGLPFPIFDTTELWLLDRERGEPLAILDAVRGDPPATYAHELQWHPFVLSYTGFRSPTLAQREAVAGAATSHREMIARTVNHSARPHAMAQWFRRGQDGVGEGMGGIRLPHDWKSRRLPAESFPEMLVREKWNSRLEQSVIADYHAWLAPLLLLWPRLSAGTRDRLEALACERPQWLARVHRLIPRVVEPARLNAALVAARLEQAQGGNEDNWIES
ncbi:MAG: hypothetical protein AB1831_03110 [Pseudomonadota bacterium]